MKKLSSLSVIFPAFNDALSLPGIIRKTAQLLPALAIRFEIIIVNDGSLDKTQSVLEKLQKRIPFIRIIKHCKNLGYGATLIQGFQKAKYDYLFYTDSDGQYDVSELRELVKAMDLKTEMVTGYKLNRSDSLMRRFVGSFYNQIIKIIFQLKVSDVDCDFRLFRRKILKNLNLVGSSGSFDAEFMKKIQKRGVIIKEIPVHHYPRKFGKSQFFKLGNLINSFIELTKIR